MLKKILFIYYPKIRYEYLLDYSLTKIKPIQVALWNGLVMGGGVGLSQNAPIRVATDNTIWAMPGNYFFYLQKIYFSNLI